MFEIYDKVKAVKGDFCGYYGQVIAIDEKTATVSHKADFEGFVIPLDDLVKDE